MLSLLRALAVVLLLTIICAPAQCFASCSAPHLPPCHQHQQHPRSGQPTDCSQQHLSAVFDKADSPQFSALDVLIEDAFSCSEFIPVLQCCREQELIGTPPVQRLASITILRI